jgi:hypothetical protein
VPAGEPLRRPGVHDDRPGVAMAAELRRNERGRLPQVDGRRPAEVHGAHPPPVGRHGGQVVEPEGFVEALLRGADAGQGGVGAPLVADGGREPAADVAAAKRPPYVRRVDRHVIAEAAQEPADRAAGGTGRGGDVVGAAEEVGPAHVPHEQSPAGEQQHRVRTAGVVVHEQAHVLGAVARGVDDLEGEVAHLDDLAIGDAAVVVAEVGAGEAQHLHVLPEP